MIRHKIGIQATFPEEGVEDSGVRCFNTYYETPENQPAEKLADKQNLEGSSKKLDEHKACGKHDAPEEGPFATI